MKIFDLAKSKLSEVRLFNLDLRKARFVFKRMLKNKALVTLFIVVISLISGFLGSMLYSKVSPILVSSRGGASINNYTPQTTEEDKVIKAVGQVSPSVVSIVITKDMPVFEQYYVNPFGEGSPFDFQIPQLRQKGTQRQEVGGGTGFVIGNDGLILTNKHVVSIEGGQYTVVTNDGRKFDAGVVATDPLQDIAIIRVKDQSKWAEKPLPPVTLGDSSKLLIGESVIAIGNALGEFQNTVSVGVISGLNRNITATGPNGKTENLDNVIQTDAAINKGNSGGPLLNLQGEVIGINSAISESGQNLGFAIPINRAKKAVEQVGTRGKITYPFIGVRYVLITPDLKTKNNLPVDYGALITKSGTAPAVVSGSAADKAGLKEGDIILELSGQKITPSNPLAKVIQNYNPGDTVILKILRSGKEKILELIFGEINS